MCSPYGFYHSFLLYYALTFSYALLLSLWIDDDYYLIFGCKCFILSTKDNLGKFDPKFDVGISLGYSNTSKIYGVYIKRTLIVEEFIHVIFDESNSSSMEKVVVDDNVDEKLQEDYQMIAKRMHHLKIKRSNMKKQMRSKMKVFLKHSLKSGGMFLLTLRT